MDYLTWLNDFATKAQGANLSARDCEDVLALAGIAAHLSERRAAPLTCWIAAAAGLDPHAALEIARSLEHEEPDENSTVE